MSAFKNDRWTWNVKFYYTDWTGKRKQKKKEEFNTFISCEDKPQLKVIFNLFFYSGIREGELLALTLNDFDFENNSVRITKSYTRLNTTDIIQEPKTSKSKRVVSLPVEIMNMIKEYSSTIYDYKPSERLFPVHKSTLSREIERVCKLSGVKKIRVHDLRHSHASLLVELGFCPCLFPKGSVTKM